MNLSIGFSTVKFHMRVKGLQTPNEFFDELVKSQKRLFLSFPRESSDFNKFWTPAFAGVTVSGTFYEAVNSLYFRIFVTEGGYRLRRRLPIPRRLPD